MPRRRRRLVSFRLRRPRLLRTLLALVLVVVVFYVSLGFWAVSRLTKVDALPADTAGTAGSTWLLVGSDSRAGLSAEERNELTTGRTEGQRTDTIILFHVPSGGGDPTLVSLPRDSYLPIPGRGSNKLNAAYAFGGAPLLVQTVQDATGLTVDHYMEVGFGGVVGVVDALGGVDICVKSALNDPRAGLDVQAGCQEMDGATSLSYVRARYSDPLGDLGRIQRQQQFLGALMGKTFSRGTVINPLRQVRLTGAGTEAITVDEGTGPIDVALFARKFRAVSGGGAVVTVPIADRDYRPGGGVGSAVRWDEEGAARLFADLEAGRDVNP